MGLEYAVQGRFFGTAAQKIPSYLTSMRAKQRVISSDAVTELGDSLLPEIAELGSNPGNSEIQCLLRAVAHVNIYLADQTTPTTIRFSGPLAGENRQPLGPLQLVSGAGDPLTMEFRGRPRLYICISTIQIEQLCRRQ